MGVGRYVGTPSRLHQQGVSKPIERESIHGPTALLSAPNYFLLNPSLLSPHFF
jgi:hypothetical protein